MEELDRCWEVTQNQDKASKIEKGIYETHGDVKMETTFMSYVTRRKLNFQQLENVLGTPLPAVIKGYATLRDAKLTECSYDKVVMWTSGSYDYDDVVRALVRLDRPKMRPGKSGHNGKSVLTYFTDPEVDAPTIVPGSELWTIKYGPTTLERYSRRTARGRRLLRGRRDDDRTRYGAIAIPGVFCITDDGQEGIEENEVPQILLQARPAFRHLGYRAIRIQQLKLRTRCARCRKLGHWACEFPEGNRGQRNDERDDRR